MVVVLAATNRRDLNLLSAFEYFLSSTIEDICRRHIAEGNMVAVMIVVVDEIHDGLFQLTGECVGKLVDLFLQGLLVLLYFTVRLGMERCRTDMIDACQKKTSLKPLEI